MAGLHCDGIVAPFVLDGPINCEAFETYVARVLVPKLASGDIVVMDNLSSYDFAVENVLPRIARVRRTVEIIAALGSWPRSDTVPDQLAPRTVVAYADGMPNEPTKRPPGRPRDPAKRAALIQAARTLFLERGSEAVTMDQVLARAEVSRATLYSNFADKGDLLAAVIAAEAERFLAGDWMQQSFDQPVELTLVRFGDGLLTFIAEADTMAFERLIAQVALADPEHSTRFFAAGPGRVRSILMAIIRAAQDRLELEEGEPEQAANDLLGLWQGMWRLEIQYGQRAGAERAELDRLVRHGVRQFLRLYAPQK